MRRGKKKKKKREKKVEFASRMERKERENDYVRLKEVRWGEIEERGKKKDGGGYT